MISPFEYCTKCGLVYCHIQNHECVVCHGDLAPLEGLYIPGRKPADTWNGTCGCTGTWRTDYIGERCGGCGQIIREAK